MVAEGQIVRFTVAGDRTVAWAAAGEGPPLVVGGWWCGHLELDWRNPLVHTVHRHVANIRGKLGVSSRAAAAAYAGHAGLL